MNSWDDLRTVLEISRSGSLSGAARQLGVSHATVFRRLRNIERRLGVLLFERSPGGYQPTLAGEEMAQAAARVHQEVEGVTRRIQGRDQRLEGVIRVTLTDSLLQGLLMPVFEAFQQRHPAIVLDVSVSNALYDLAARDAEVAIRPSNQPPETLVGRRVGSIRQAIYVARDGDISEPGDITAWIDQGQRPDDAALAAWMEDKVEQAMVRFRCDSLLGRQQAARRGLGAVVLPRYLGDADVGLKQVGDELKALAVDLWLLAHQDMRQVVRIRLFIDFLAESLRARLAPGAADPKR